MFVIGVSSSHQLYIASSICELNTVFSRMPLGLCMLVYKGLIYWLLSFPDCFVFLRPLYLRFIVVFLLQLYNLFCCLRVAWINVIVSKRIIDQEHLYNFLDEDFIPTILYGRYLLYGGSRLGESKILVVRWDNTKAQLFRIWKLRRNLDLILYILCFIATTC